MVRDSGKYDETGVPITEDAFEFTNEEALIKFFALKNYLKEKFLPLNTRIIDISGEGVYYERYTINSWKDVDQRRVVELTRPIDFTYEKRVPIEDLRPYSTVGYFSPTLERNLIPFLFNYDILDIKITNPGGTYTSIPAVSFPGSSKQQARGYVKVKGMSGSYALANPSGVGFSVNDIITLGGGVYEIPLRLTVTSVSAGAVAGVDIWDGYRQGSGYSSFPTTFSQTNVISTGGGQNQTSAAVGFTAAPTDLGFEVEDVIFLDKGLGYSSIPNTTFTPNIGNTTAELSIKTNSGVPVGNINNRNFTNKWNDAPNIPVGGIATLSTSFDTTWDDTQYSWYDIGGDSDAQVKLYTDPLPNGSGTVIAAEIIRKGSGYTFVPQITVNSRVGQNGSLEGSIRNGGLNILEYTVSNILSVGGGTNNRFTVTPAIAGAGSLSVSSGRVVKSDKIDGLLVTGLINQPQSQITLSTAGGSFQVSTSLVPGDKVYIHEGIAVTNGGSGYDSFTDADVNGGHSRRVFTWNTLGRGEFYEMGWKVSLEEPEVPTNQFNYDTGIRPIDELINHEVVLPYTGKYTVEMIVYNTNNSFVNEIKRSCIEVYMYESDFSFVSQFLYGRKDSWDSFQQLPNTQQNRYAQSIDNNRNVQYTWENAISSWVNSTFNTTKWNNLDFRWTNLDVNEYSPINRYTFPVNNVYNAIRVSPSDNLEGNVLSYTGSSYQITVSGQRKYPKIKPSYNSTDNWIFIRRDESVFQLEVTDADYDTDQTKTIIGVTGTIPLSFEENPKTWEVLREIGGTIVLEGDQIYNAETKPNGIRSDKFVRIYQRSTTPLRKRVPINGKNTYTGIPDSLSFNGYGNDLVLGRVGEIGRIYRVRDNKSQNGNLVWSSTTSSSTWIFRPDENNNSYENLGKFYIS